MPDKDGYPAGEELAKIRNWPWEDPMGLIAFIKDLWWPADWKERGFECKGKRVIHLTLHTLGWSGNEDIMAALIESDFWTLYWQKSTVGGHYYFRIDLDRWKKAEREAKRRGASG